MKVVNGLIAGLAATAVLSTLMLMKAAMGMMPQVDAIQMLVKIASTDFGLPMQPAVRWVLHLLIGIGLWGALFAATVSIWPGGFVVKGVCFSIAAWLLMMLIVMPMAGAGVFGLNLGIVAPVATLILHLVYGAVLGATYRALQRRRLAATGKTSSSGR